jgi:hypothetical protein
MFYINDSSAHAIFFPKKNPHVLTISTHVNPQQPSTSKLNVLKLKDRLHKNKCPLRSSIKN